MSNSILIYEQPLHGHSAELLPRMTHVDDRVYHVLPHHAVASDRTHRSDSDRRLQCKFREAPQPGTLARAKMTNVLQTPLLQY
ncbi:hypothetical protein V495_04737 [Pseudogymnoascus sp. VKM F-4514 (FW-929)]|nr:hypothetical protein V495_04737 [Pseudogymnoascus sp. VKM F-4514 (FW-929)]KFY61195.1 hypothetical protein V497_03071 [Pseudogymnoascus sp. VKM F-4516 (FW-969)]